MSKAIDDVDLNAPPPETGDPLFDPVARRVHDTKRCESDHYDWYDLEDELRGECWLAGFAAAARTFAPDKADQFADLFHRLVGVISLNRSRPDDDADNWVDRVLLS